MGVWALAFGAMSASGHLGDEHPGQWTPFWEQACAADKRDACLNLYFLHDGYCADGSAWSCNEVGILLAERYDNRRVAAAAFDRACTLQFAAGCDNAAAIASGSMLRHDDPTAADYRFILRGSKGPIEDRDPAALYARACEWVGPAPADPANEARRLDELCAVEGSSTRSRRQRVPLTFDSTDYRHHAEAHRPDLSVPGPGDVGPCPGGGPR